MKRLSCIFATMLLLSSCYEDYTMDYDYSAAYIAYQYDLRTFVIGEGMKFDFTVALGGVQVNEKDRAVSVALKDELLTDKLSSFSSDPQVASFTAIDGLKGAAPIGHISQNYVSQEVSAAGLTQLTPLPKDCYDIIGLDGLKIKKGRHTATVTIKANDKLSQDAKAFKPYYALGFQLNSADADVVVREKSFAVIAVKCEHMLYGNWYYGGSAVVKKASGDIVSENHYQIVLPQADDKVKSIKTISADCVECDSPYAGKIRLTVNGENVTIAAVNSSVRIGTIDGEPSRYNNAKLLQDRKLYLNYTVANYDGSVTYVRDELWFRNRIRDGVNEWQDENPENYN